MVAAFDEVILHRHGRVARDHPRLHAGQLRLRHHEEVDEVAARHLAEDVAVHPTVIGILADEDIVLAVVGVGRGGGGVLLPTLAVVVIHHPRGGIPVRQEDAVHHVEAVLRLECRNESQAGDCRLVKWSAGERQDELAVAGEPLVPLVVPHSSRNVVDVGQTHALRDSAVEVVGEHQVQDSLLVLLLHFAARETDHAEVGVEARGVRHIDLGVPIATLAALCPALEREVLDTLAAVRLAIGGQVATNAAAAEGVDLVGNLGRTAERDQAGQLRDAGHHASAHAAAPIQHEHQTVRLALANVHRRQEQLVIVAVLMDAGHVENPRSGDRRLVELRRRLLPLKVCDHAGHGRLVEPDHAVDERGVVPLARLAELLNHLARRQIADGRIVGGQGQSDCVAVVGKRLPLAGCVDHLLRESRLVMLVALLACTVSQELAFALVAVAVPALALLRHGKVGRGLMVVDVLADIDHLIERLGGGNAIHEHLFLRRERNFKSGVDAQLEVQVDPVDQRHLVDVAVKQTVEHLRSGQQTLVAVEEGATQTGIPVLHLAFDSCVLHDVEEQLGTLLVLGVDAVDRVESDLFSCGGEQGVADFVSEQHLACHDVVLRGRLQDRHGEQAILRVEGGSLGLAVVDDAEVLRGEQAGEVVLRCRVRGCGRGRSDVECGGCHSAAILHHPATIATSYYKKGCRLPRLS